MPLETEKTLDDLVQKVEKLNILNVAKDDDKEDKKKEESEDEEVEQITSAKTDEEEDNGYYTSKGPIRGNQNQSRHTTAPYERPNRDNNVDLDAIAMGRIMDEIYPELEAILCNSKLPDEGIPGLPNNTVQQGPMHILNGLDDVFTGLDPEMSHIILRNDSEPTGFTALSVPLSVVIDVRNDRIGINMPKTGIPSTAVYRNRIEPNKLEISIQLDPMIKKLIKVMAEIEMVSDEQGLEKWMIKQQFLRLQPFERGCGVLKMLEGVTKIELELAYNKVRRMSLKDLTQPVGPNNDSTLMYTFCQKYGSEYNQHRADIFAMVKRMLFEVQPSVRRSIIHRSSMEFGVLEYLCVFNRHEMVRFFAEIVYILGEDLMEEDGNGNTLIHILARGGEQTADSLQVLMQMRFHNGRRAFPLDVCNEQGEIPLHIAAQSKVTTRAYNILAKEFPEGFAFKTKSGEVPLHCICKVATDPNMLATALQFNKSVVNLRSDDGMTPLHLLARRCDLENNEKKIFPLDDETQVRMIRLLLDYGADVTMKWDNVYPMHLLDGRRTKAKILLRLNLNSDIGQNSPAVDFWNNLGSPPDSICSSQQSPMPSENYTDSIASPYSSGYSGSPLVNNFCESSPSPYGSGVSDGEENEQLDAIAALLIQHPVIKDVLDHSDISNSP